MIDEIVLQIPSELTLHLGTYMEAVHIIEEDSDKALVMKLKDVPFKQSDKVLPSALLKRKDPAFYLVNELPTKNLSLLGSTQKLYYNNPLVPLYVQAINQEISCEQWDVKELNSIELAIHTQSDWSSKSMIRLSTEEFVPEVSQGIYVVLCSEKNITLRRFVSRFHDEDTYDCSNIEREIQRDWSQYSKNSFISCHVSKDERANYYGTVVCKHGGKLVYVSLSRSTTFGFVKAIMDKMIG